MRSWIRALDDLDPDLVVNTGDSIAHPQAVRYFLDALGPLLDRPGVFVLGSNDLYAPEPFNPARYLLGPSSRRRKKKEPDLPWEKLQDGMTAAGWLDLNNQRGQLTAGGLDIALAGVHDSHIKRDRYAQVAGPADAGGRPPHSASCTHPSRGCSTSSRPTATTCCSPGTRTAASCACRGTAPLVTNCGIDRKRARGLHRHPATGRPGCTCPPGWAPRRGPRPGSPAALRPACSPWSRAIPADPAGAGRAPAGPGAQPGPSGSAFPLDCRRFARHRGSVRAAGCSAAWQRASFGTKRPPVQIRPPRPAQGTCYPRQTGP